MKLKHNKLRNTGLLFELLVRQITTDTLNNKESAAVDILKENFNNSLIAKEYKIYKAILNNKNLSEAKANIVLEAAIEAHKKINKNSLNAQKYKLISQIKENYNIEDFFKSKIENYKTIASVYMLFETYQSDSVDPEVSVKYRFSIMEDICAGMKQEDKDPVFEEYSKYDRGTKALVYKLAIQKFNEKYSNLNENQRGLMKRYISSISTPESFKEYINEETIRVKNKLKSMLPRITDQVRYVKVEEVTNLMREIPNNKPVLERDVENLLYYYELETEMENV